MLSEFIEYITSPGNFFFKLQIGVQFLIFHISNGIYFAGFFSLDVCFMRLRSLDEYGRYYMFPQNRCIFLHWIHVLLFSSLQNVTYVWIHASIILLLQYVFYRYWDENLFNGYLNTLHSFECNIVSRCNVRYGHFNF